MEPMTISPPSSGMNQYHQNAPSTPSFQHGYLPGYLLGDAAQQSPMSNRSATHMDQASSIVGHGHTPKMPYGGNQGQFTPQHMNKTPLQQCLDSSNHGLIDSEKKPGGPPTTLLANSTTAIAPNLPLQGTPKQIGGLKNALVINESPIPAPSDCSWVTVFGFPPSSSSLILSQFSRYGHITAHHHGGNNWLHLKYESRMQAQKALSKSTQVIAGGTIMIGVVPCTDQEVMSSAGNNASIFETSQLHHTGANQSVTTGTRLNSSIRPLAQTLKASSTTHHNLGNHNDTPTKNSGIVGKALELLFGF